MSSPNPDIDVNALMRGLVHELRNPLSAILTATSLLQPGGDIDEETAMLLEVVKKESRRMNRILTEFASFVKPPHPQIELFDLASLVRDMTHDLQSEEALQGRVEIRDELPAAHWVQGDSLQTAQVLRHVLNNSAEAMHENGTLKLLLCHDPDSSDICIEDSGAGLAEGALEKAFQPFFSTKPTATGLGLSISRGLLRAFDGDLTIENLEDESAGSDGGTHGARVRIHLPPAPPPSNKVVIDTD